MIQRPASHLPHCQRLQESPRVTIADPGLLPGGPKLLATMLDIHFGKRKRGQGARTEPDPVFACWLIESRRLPRPILARNRSLRRGRLPLVHVNNRAQTGPWGMTYCRESA